MIQRPLMIDVAGPSLEESDRRRLQNLRVGGVILFGRNYRGRETLTALCAEMKAINPQILIAVDHEGGRVQRFRTDGFTHLPPMKSLGDVWDQDPMQGMKLAHALGWVLAAELRATGIDMSFAPVLDLAHGPSAVIGDRALHRDPRVVSFLASALVAGMRDAGLIHCAKHFPGHGQVKADSHVDVPVDRRSLKALLSDDAVPYAHLSQVLDAVMPSHVIYPKVDALPAGYSPRWLGEILRQKLGFQGLVISDDLSMEGARRGLGRTVSMTQAVHQVLGAGCDMALVCNQSLHGGAVLDALLDGMETSLKKGQWVENPLAEERRQVLLQRAQAQGGAPTHWETLVRNPRYVQNLEDIGRICGG